MAEAIRSLFFDYKSKVDDASILKANKHVDSLKANLMGAKLAANQMTKNLLGVAAGYLSIRGLAAGIGSLTAAANESIDSETRLSNMMKNVKGTTDAQVSAISQYASALQARGVAEDDAIKRGNAQLATFNLQADAIKMVTDGMADLAVNQFGVAVSGEQMQGIANVIGKAFDGSTESLKRYGVSMTEAQKNTIKNGTQMRKAAVIAEILKANVGGINEALAKTPKGAEQRFKNMFGDMKEELGMKLLPEITKFYEFMADKLPDAQRVLSGAIDTGLKKFGEMKSFLENYVEPRFYRIGKLMGELTDTFFPNLGTAAGDLQGNLGKIVTEGLDLLESSLLWIRDNSDAVYAGLSGIAAGIVTVKTATLGMAIVGTLAPILSSIGFAVAAVAGGAATLGEAMLFVMGPIGWVALAVGALVTVGVLLYRNWDKIKVKAVELGADIKAAFTGIGELLKGVLQGVANIFKGYINNYIKIANFLIGGLNKVQFKAPDWVPLIGGKTFGVNIPKIPEFEVGINRVPKTMLAVVHKDEQITPAKYNPYNPNARMAAEKRQPQQITYVTNNNRRDGNSVTNNYRDNNKKQQAPITINIYGNADDKAISKLKNMINEVLDQRDREEYHSVAPA